MGDAARKRPGSKRSSKSSSSAKAKGPQKHVPGLALGASVELDKLIHERVRLAIVSALAVHDTLSFNDLKEMLGATDGNLSVHARKLEDAGYVSCTKSFSGRTPKTEYKLTAAGRRSFERYLAHMEALIRSVRKE